MKLNLITERMASILQLDVDQVHAAFQLLELQPGVAGGDNGPG